MTGEGYFYLGLVVATAVLVLGMCAVQAVRAHLLAKKLERLAEETDSDIHWR